ncbi:hypothetical protein ACT3SP_07150 [Brachybacterium sp. AOP43-C2-M15]|uniref:hypothetical protein n=1 Tax=Brachybacterium sp. AOP43-C2-M15 TaxID=3457661 RepID=UPI0040335492
MAMTHPDGPDPRWRGSKPGAGRPLLFALLLVAAALGMLALLVVGPSMALPLAIAAAGALMGLVGVAWVVAGPRL